MKGIILAGGTGSRLYPLTKVISKQLLPVYDKPMIYYPLSVLMLAGIREILIISTPNDLPNFKKLFGDGSQLGLKFAYAEQARPDGLAQAFMIGEEFIGNDNVCMILGDNIFYGTGLINLLNNSTGIVERENKAVIFGYNVENPQRYGVAEFDKDQNVVDIVEKPKEPKSNYAITGLYFYPNDVVKIAKSVKPSWRNELEITDINKAFLKNKRLKLQLLGRGYVWLDTGTNEALSDATEFVRVVEKRTGLMIGCIEENAYKMKYIDKIGIEKIILLLGENEYKRYIIRTILNK